jgi:Spy/CpxP family protein refolding chaperone
MRWNPKLALALLALLLLPIVAQAAPGPDANQAAGLLENPRALARFLHLSADQVTQFNALAQTLRTTVTPLQQARGPLCQTLRTALGAATPDQGAVGAGSLALFNNKKQIGAARTTFDNAFKALLTPDQLAKYNVLLQLHGAAAGRDVNLLGDCPPAGS